MMTKEPAELCCVIIAWIELVVSGLFIGVVGLFTLILLFVPDVLQEIIDEDPEQHREISEFLSQEGGSIAGFIILLLLFWAIIFGLAFFLLRWTKGRNVTGLKTWIWCMLAITIISIPLDLKMMHKEGFPINSIIIFILGNGYAAISIVVVYYYRRLIILREGSQNSQIVEFQALA